MAMPDPTTPPAAARLVRPDYSTDTVASGPSVILDDRALENSPVPSQLTQQAGGGRLPRQRPRFYTVQDLDVALNQAIEGKINSKNAWASKEASDLLEGITHTIENTLENDTTDNYSGFAKAATVVEGCSKVWTSRVDSTHLRSNLMVQRLLRNEEDSGAGPTESGEGEESEAQESQSRRARSRAKTMARTLAMEASEINLDSKAMTALTQTGLNAQFRAITEKFDQGNAQGLLTNNAPLGRVGNVILDVDYSQVVGQFSAKKAKQLARGSDSAVSSARTSGEVCVKVEEGQVSGNSSARPSLLHQAVFLPVEEDGDIDVVLDDLPEFLPRTSGELDDVPRASHHTALRGSAGVREGGAAVSDLLALNHAAFVKEEAEEAVVAPAAVASHHVSLGYQADEEHPLPLDDDGDYGGDDFGGMGDDITYAEDEDDDDGAADVGAEARQLVTGIRELEAVDSLFAGGVQLALEAENPTSWCPMADIPQNALAGPAPGSELSQLHKKCRLGATGGGGDAGATAKRAKKEGRTVTFDASVIGAHVANAASSPTFSLNQSDTDQGALKQSTTSTKNVTPLGRDLLFKKEASQLATSFMQSTTQKAKAEEAHLLLPSPPIPGTTLPDFLPYPVTIASFFQPFSTSLSEWNLLRKSVSGRILDEAAELRRSGGASTEEEGPRSAMGDLPMEFFPTGAEADDDDLGGYGDYDGHSDVDSVAEYQLNAEKQLLAQFEAVTTSAAASADASARGSAGDNPARLSTDPEVLLKALHPTAAIMANQVDVVRLRQTMWEALQSIMKENPHVKMAEEEDSGEAAAEAEKIGAADESVMKRHALRALHRGQRGKRPREADSISERRQNTAEVEEDENEDHHLPSEMDALLPHFSEVVQRILPEVPSISSTGSLSPAFLFFSMLFLVNEHNIVLANAPTLDDLTVRGTKSRIGVVKA